MAIKSAWVSKQDAGDANMQELAGYIAKGAMAFLKAEWKVLGIFVAFAAALLAYSGTIHEVNGKEIHSSWIISIAFIIGAVWHSPVLFGNTWMKIMGADKYSKDELKKMQKEMGKFYALQFFLTILTMFVLYQNIKYFGGKNGVSYAIFMWLGYVLPIQVSSVIWGSTDKKWWCSQIGILAGLQLVIFIIAGYIFTNF